MRLVLFFKCLCYLLLQGHPAIYAGSGHNSVYAAPAQHSRSYQQTNQTCTGSAYLAAANPDLLADLEDSMDDADDEGDYDLQAAVYGLPLWSHAIYGHPSYASLLRHRSNCFKAAPAPVPGQVSDICIAQSVLRI